MKKATTSELLGKGFVVNNGKWSYNGTPCVIDFYAEWCVPCKPQLTVLSDLSKEYEDVDFYTVNVEEEYELAELFNIRNLPTVYVCGKDTKKLFTGFTQRTKIEEVLKTQIGIHA